MTLCLTPSCQRVVFLPLPAWQESRDLHPYFTPKGGYTRAVVDTLQLLKQPE